MATDAMSLAAYLTVGNVVFAALVAISILAINHYVVNPLWMRFRIRSGFRLESSGPRSLLHETPFVPVLGDFGQVGAAKFKVGFPLRHGARCTAQNFEHDVVTMQAGATDERTRTERNHDTTVLGNMAYLTVITTSSHDIVRDVLITKSSKFGKPPFVRLALEPVIGFDNLVLLEGDAHASRRRLLSPAFSIRNLRKLVPAFARAARVHVRRIAREAAEIASKTPHRPMRREILPWVSRLTLDVIGFAAFGGFEGDESGASSSGATSAASRVAHAIEGLAEQHNIDMNRNPLHVLLPKGMWAAVPTPSNLDKTARFRELCEVADAVVAARKADLAAMDEGAARPTDILQLMIDARDEEAGSAGRKAARALTPQQIRDEGLLLIFAGHETTAVLTNWALFLLSQYPEWAERAREEAERARRAFQCPFEAEAPEGHARAEWRDPMTWLPVTTGVLKETLRLFPPVALYSRMSLEDVTVGDKGRCFLPRGTSVNVAAGCIHRDPVAWPDPHCFDPARWMTDEQVASLGLKRITAATAAEWMERRFEGGDVAPSAAEESSCAHPRHVPKAGDVSYVPFASGATGCIGRQFAMYEASCILPYILTELDLTLADEYVHAPVTLMTTRPREGMAMDIRPRRAEPA